MLDEGDGHRPLPVPAGVVRGAIEDAARLVTVGRGHAAGGSHRSHDVEHAGRIEGVPGRVGLGPRQSFDP